MKKVIFYLKDSEISNPGNLYPVTELEIMYSNLLKSDDIHHNNCTTSFADLVVKYVPDLNKKIASNRVSTFFDTAAIGLNRSSETYFDSPVRVIGRVRKARHGMCQEHSLSLNVDLQIQLYLVPTELVQLIISFRMELI